MTPTGVGRTFRRPTRHTNRKDQVGRVRVQITLLTPGGGHHMTGNIVRSFTLRNTTVSSVALQVERGLFEEDERA